MQPSAPLISFVLPAYNEAGHLPATILALHEALQPHPGCSYEVIVCDNNSTDSTATVAESLGARVVFEAHNQIARARNTGARHAEGQWLCFVDSDTLVPTDLASKLLELLCQPDTGGGGTLVRFDLEEQPFFPSLVLQFWNSISGLFRLAAGSFLFCRREAWEETGGFDESFYAAEELIFSQALKGWCRKKGLKFKIISDSFVLTSARKLHWNSQFKLFLIMFSLLRPGALKSREGCSFWYQRPSVKP
jgi:cellulose synthase/poly-beta-1,6-N-acetylglucosamine synthase-like glycosyltransferase